MKLLLLWKLKLSVADMSSVLQCSQCSAVEEKNTISIDLKNNRKEDDSVQLTGENRYSPTQYQRNRFMLET